MTRAAVSTTAAPAPGGAYEQAIADAGFLFTSGCVGLDPVSKTTPTDLRREILQAFRNLEAVLAAGGATLDSVVRTLCFITDVDDFALFNETYTEFFGEALPARSTICVQLAGGYRFEIEATARVVGA
jgi:2-iminobutanoate/2-iminopropanoate deaminase